MIVDAHVHLDAYAAGLEEALREIRECRILTVAVSMDVASYLRTREIAAGTPWVLPTFGIHPWRAAQYCDSLSPLDDWLADTPLIGECGLDFHWETKRELYPCQRKVFEYQCDWAHRLGKPMNLHTKGAEGEVLEALRAFKVPPSIVHWYSGPTELIDRYLSVGTYFTVGVEALLSEQIQEIARRIPVDRLLLETDNPGGYEWLTGRIGMPRLACEVLAKVAALRNMEPGELEERLWQNWTTLTANVALPPLPVERAT